MPLTLSDFEIEVGKHSYNERHRLVLKLGPHEYTRFVMLMLELHGTKTVTHCLGVPVVEDPKLDGIKVERVK